jgi:hypothetical protein
MFNPLLEDLTQIKDSELENKMSDLNKKYNIALRMGNGQVSQQIAIVIEAIRDEVLRRQHEASKKLLAKQNKDLDGLINIG